jgi:glutamate N-acetyltransferase/amino-acid N-acetyltransferase
MIINMKQIEGSVTAPKGFRASGIHCGIRKNRAKKDLALIAAGKECAAAAVYTGNKVKGAPLIVTAEHLKNGRAQAVICNSGNANTCNADGIEIADQMSAGTAKALGISPEDVIVASTGVIGQPLPLDKITAALPRLAEDLSDRGFAAAEEAIMTTDTRRKGTAVEFMLGGKTCRIGGIAKGSGMIHPNMATLLSFLTTDAAIAPGMLHEALLRSVQKTYNMVSIDGDTSTNDMASILASGLAGNAEITAPGADFDAFCAGLDTVLVYLAKEIARDGEGASRLIECVVEGAADEAAARAVAKAVISSNLLKAAIFGADANWGRVLCAVGNAPADVDVQKVDVSFESEGGSLQVCKAGYGVDFSENQARAVLVADEIVIRVGLNSGSATATAWGCDLTYDYVKINGDYRT